MNPVAHITFDALDPYRAARFWSEVTGFAVHPDDKEGDDEVLLEPQPAQGGVPGLLFVRVPDAKSVKNRVHLDIRPPTGTRDEAGQAESIFSRRNGAREPPAGVISTPSNPPQAGRKLHR
ncbi:VOC family protein [Streptomyces sp. NPDC054946]